MAKEQPSTGFRVYPLFYLNGFKIIYIEHQFKFPEEVAKKISASSLEIGESPQPELIIGREDDQKAIYFEAKASSFGARSSNSRQARAHLLACGPPFGEVYPPINNCILCYIVPRKDRTLMAECLSELSEELKDSEFEPGRFTVSGLSYENRSIVYSWDAQLSLHMGLSMEEIPLIQDIEEETDPSPLLLVFSDEDCFNNIQRDIYRRAVIDQARAYLLGEFHRQRIHEKYLITTDRLLDKISDGIFEYIDRNRQNRLNRLIRNNLFKKIYEYWSEKRLDVSLHGYELSIIWNSEEEKVRFLDWLEDRRTRFEYSKPQDDKGGVEEVQIEFEFPGIESSKK